MPETHQLELLVDDAIFGESPRWHEHALWFSDIGDDKVWRIGPDGTRTLVLAAVKAPSGLGWTQCGDLLVTSLHDHTIYRMGPDGVAQPFCGPEQHGTVGTNDMATWGSRSYVTCAGRVFQAGDTMEEIAQPVGRVIMIDHDTGAASTVAQGYAMPNGIVLSPDGSRLVFSELFGSRLLEFDVASDGTLLNERTFATLDGYADGICLDAGGAIWASVSSGDRSSWQRVDMTGAVLESIPLGDGWRCIACALGGRDGHDLFLVANKTETPDDVFNGKARCRVFRTRALVPAPSPAP
jgi:sugar lactone lactonase YvrE